MSPSETQGHGNHPRWDDSCAGVLISGFDEKPGASPEWKIKSAAQAPADASTSNAPQNYICRDESGEERIEEWIEEKFRRETRLREFYRTPVIADASDDVRIHVSEWMKVDFGIH